MLDLGVLEDAAPYTTERTLSVEENRRIFWDEIVPAELAHAVPQTLPTVVFLVGQQGAGKARISNQIAQRLDESGGYVDVDSDLYKPYHPSYQQFLVENDREMAHHTRPDGRRWMAQAEAYVRGDRIDGLDGSGISALMQETAQDPAAVVDKLREYRDTHRIEIAVLGVPQAMSLQGILHRYHEQVSERGHGRLTEQARRELSYNGILELADKLAEPLQQTKRSAATQAAGQALTPPADAQPSTSSSSQPRSQPRSQPPQQQQRRGPQQGR